MKNLYVVIYFIFGSLLINLSCLNNYAFSNEVKSINWVSLQEAFELAEESPKKIIVYLHTDWCGYCKRMNEITFQNPIIIDIINEQYYPVKFNGETIDTIKYRGVEYINRTEGRRGAPHDFTLALLQNKVGYPAFSFFDEELNVIFAVKGFHNPKKFEPVLMFFAEDAYYDYDDMDSYIIKFQSSFE